MCFLCVFQLAHEEGCTNMTWIVMDNFTEIEFYEKMGGKIKKDWLTMKLTEPELENLLPGKAKRTKVHHCSSSY